MGSEAVQPLSTAERLPVLDALRGVAIFGVLVSYTLWSLGSPPPETWSRLDRVVNAAGDVLVDGKFLTIFAFLFGVGIAQQWRRVEAQGQSPVALHLRRMLFLLAVGLLHGAFLRNGDILAPYAILGLALLAARRRSTRALIGVAAVLAILPYGVQGAMHWAGWNLPDRPGPEAGNLTWLRYWYLTNPLLSWPRILAVMLAGVVAERARLIAALATDRGLAQRILWSALPLALAGRAILSLLASRWDAQPMTLAKGIVLNLLYTIAAWSLAAVYAAGLALLCQRPGWVTRLGWLRATGRMAFTNYAMQALLIVPLCLALGLFDRVTPTLGVLLALGVAAVEIPLSVWWLRHHRYGPLEWLWRTVTYGDRPRPEPGVLT